MKICMKKGRSLDQFVMETMADFQSFEVLVFHAHIFVSPIICSHTLHFNVSRKVQNSGLPFQGYLSYNQNFSLKGNDYNLTFEYWVEESLHGCNSFILATCEEFWC